ncbi:hypothetical protein HCH52_08760 [Oscillospiraceae bacterium HV4-5-C5C]|nr:hypothetical protein [Oscillospiraceae bacterium HV4-5-C5C]
MDYNKVGQLAIFGYGTNDTILNAIQKQVISASLSIDTAQIGQDSLNSLLEYEQTGFANDYISIEPAIVRQDNAADYLQAASTALTQDQAQLLSLPTGTESTAADTGGQSP